MTTTMMIKSTITDYINQQTIWLEKDVSGIALFLDFFVNFVSVYMLINYSYTLLRKMTNQKQLQAGITHTDKNFENGLNILAI